MRLGRLAEWRGDQRLVQACDSVEAALNTVIANPGWRTPDLGGPFGTTAIGERVAATIKG